ncbi:hypothetical protein JRO89_XS05G0199400 [Xanthoceras sorbifolium]|uniref:Glutamine amidotransferase domain-containing protein n=1 Tax=Xanthoceras sorbifolium TaxID=99658 RepID=A0ABQ8I2L5_9ROSI|nr:hypothetical protein JRO89_XS05G0199400 [Xanthoceras sorbifolium]
MDAAVLSQSSFIQTKPSLSCKRSLQTPPITQLSTFSARSRLRFVAKKRNGSAKWSMAMVNSNARSSVLDNCRKINNDPIIVIDNYDSFTYNLCQYMGELGCHFEVYRNDELTVEELKRYEFVLWPLEYSYVMRASLRDQKEGRKHDQRVPQVAA